MLEAKRGVIVEVQTAVKPAVKVTNRSDRRSDRQCDPSLSVSKVAPVHHSA